MSTKVIDTHIHLCEAPFTWEANPWLASEGAPFQRQWSEADLRAAAEASSGFDTVGGVFVECGNEPALDEAKWVLAMVDDAESLIGGVIANIPCKEGAEATSAFLGALRDESGALPRGLKGGRQVFLGAPMPPPDACLDSTFLAGLKVLEEAGLIWEWCCKPEALPHVATVCAQFPAVTFVLNHLGHNGGGNDLESWAVAITALAACPNVVAKMGACEEWACDDPAPYLDHALAAFGFDRCLAEGNWFVNAACGDAYDKSFGLLKAACARAGASDADVARVFASNARRVYGLE